ncbi:hypothetical protein SynA1524_01381 [Synechococcus sp. A15-24]|nr:hypothetical protein SynA1524_01381 [Synechococcus sp. A15-24]
MAQGLAKQLGFSDLLLGKMPMAQIQTTRFKIIPSKCYHALNILKFIAIIG